MDVRQGLRRVRDAAIVCAALCCSATALAQGYGVEATVYSPWNNLNLQALRVGNKVYNASLMYRPPASWQLVAAEELPYADPEYATNSYSQGVLELRCVSVNGEYYSARLFAPLSNYYFTLASHTKLEACPLPAGIGPARGQWVRTAQAPLGARNDAVLVWTGEEILVLGGSDFFCPASASCIAPTTPLYRDGAAYNPATDTWRKLADAPVGILSALAVGTDVFAFGRKDFYSFERPLLRYRVNEDRWEEVVPPVDMLRMSLAAFGDKLLLYVRDTTRDAAADWLFDPVTGTWTTLPPSPLGAGYSRDYLASGTDLYLFDHALTPAPGGADGPNYLRAARLRGQQWTQLPNSDSIGSAPTLIAGQRLIAPSLGCADGGRRHHYGRCIPFGAVFDTQTDSWQALPNAPGRGYQGISSSGGLSDTDLELVAPGYPALDATTGEWFIVPALDADRFTQRNTRATGPYGFAFGGATSRGVLLNDGWIWRP